MRNIYAQLLFEAKDLLLAGEERYICSALYRAGMERGCLIEANEIQKGIQRALGGNVTMESWLAFKGVNLSQYADINSRVRAHRCAWIDLLIEEWNNVAGTTH